MSITIGSAVTPEGEAGSGYLNTISLLFPDKRGAVFAFFSISPPEPTLKPIAGILKQHLTSLASRAPSQSQILEGRFEQAVQNLNDALADFLGNPDIHIAVGAARNDLLLLTGIGNLSAVFLREEKPGTYHVYNLFSKLQDKDSEKVFGALITGEIKPGDILGITTPDTLETLGANTWKQALSSMRANEAAGFIRNTLITKEANGAALVLNFGKEVEAKEYQPSPDTSIKALGQAAIHTQKILQGAVAPVVLSSLRRAGEAGGQVLRALGANALRSLKSAAHGRKRPRLEHVHPVKLWKKRPHLHRSTLRDLGGASTRLGNLLVERFNALPRKGKLILVAIIVFVVVFCQSIIYLGFRRDLEAEHRAYEGFVTEIVRMQNEAEASLIYRDEEKARALLLDASERTGALPLNSRSRRKTSERLQSEIEEALVDLRHEIITTPEVLATLPAENPGTFDSWLYAYADETAQAITHYDGRTIGLTKENALFELGGDGSITTIESSFPKTPVTDVKLFGTRLYALVPSASQVYRLSRAGNGFGGGSPWITDGSSISTAQAMAIDGAIYVLESNRVKKFFTGVREDWTPYIDPPLEDSKRIWTHDEIEGIYILEGRRIIVLSKPGALLAQYIFPEGSELRDFAVDEPGRKLSVLNGDQIEQIPLSHLE